MWSPRLSFPEVGFLVGTVHIKFFEGTRESTDDLEYERTIGFRVAKERTKRVTVEVNNRETGGGIVPS